MDAVAAAITTTNGGRIMAGGNRLGPRGMGPMTGRGLGNCAGNDQGRGRGANRRFGGFFGGSGRRGGGGNWVDYNVGPDNLEYQHPLRELAAETTQLRERIAVLEELLNKKK